MGLLRHVETGRTAALEPEHLVGRRHRSDLVLNEGYVSVEHASIRWGGTGWEVRDLDSLNGTLVNGKRLRPRHALRLRCGDLLTFGRGEQTWELVDDAAPRVMVVPLDEPGDALFIDGDILAMPSRDDPRATVFRDADGAWHLEQEHEVALLNHHSVFEVGGRRFRFSCRDVLPETSMIDCRNPKGTELARVRLSFRVSKDEEHVELALLHESGERVDLGTRNFNYALLVLARQRISDALEGTQDSACGWMYQDDLVHGLKISSERLNIDIFRIRTHFAGIGIVDAGKVIERRPRTRQLRIGTSALAVEMI
jgi:hypothetical protein